MTDLNLLRQAWEALDEVVVNGCKRCPNDRCRPHVAPECEAVQRAAALDDVIRERLEGT